VARDNFIIPMHRCDRHRWKPSEASEVGEVAAADLVRRGPTLDDQSGNSLIDHGSIEISQTRGGLRRIGHARYVKFALVNLPKLTLSSAIFLRGESTPRAGGLREGGEHVRKQA